MDLLLEEFLGRRGLDRSHLDLVGAQWEASTGRILFPRYGRDPSDQLPQREVPVVGWKVRDLLRDQHFNTPAGISGSDTWPLLARISVEASGLFVCEGETDTMRLAGSSLPERFSSDVMCAPGTNSFQDVWLPFLRQYETVIVMADGDSAGLDLPNKIASLVPGTRCAQMPQGDDVCSFLMRNSDEDLAAMISSAPLHLVKQSVRRTNWEWDDAASDQHRDKLLRVVSKDVMLSKRGADEFVGLCPFHEDHRPSFWLNARKGLYRCWGCDARGDVITYLKATQGMDFKEAVRALEEIK